MEFDKKKIWGTRPGSIRIPPGRPTRDLGNVDELVESFREIGQIEPIVVEFKDGNYELVAGRRRLEAAIKLGWDYISCIKVSDLDEITRLTIILHENTKRHNLSWDEECDEIRRLEELKEAKEGKKQKGPEPIQGGERQEGFGQKDLAKAIGVTPTKVSQAIKISKAMEKKPELRNQKSARAVLNLVKQEEMNRIRKELAKRAAKSITEMFICGDGRKEIKRLGTESVGCIIADIPYDADIEGRAYCNSDRMKYDGSEFDDTGSSGLDLVEGISEELFRVLTPGGHIWMFCGMDQVLEIRRLLTKAGFNVRHMPIVWDKVTVGYTPTPHNRIANDYEIIIHGKKGTRDYRKESKFYGKGDVWHIPRLRGQEKEAINEKPVALLAEMVLLSTEKGELVLDFCCGSGTTVEAALRTGRKGLGIDKNQSVINIGMEKIARMMEV